MEDLRRLDDVGVLLHSFFYIKIPPYKNQGPFTKIYSSNKGPCPHTRTLPKTPSREEGRRGKREEGRREEWVEEVETCLFSRPHTRVEDPDPRRLPVKDQDTGSYLSHPAGHPNLLLEPTPPPNRILETVLSRRPGPLPSPSLFPGSRSSLRWTQDQGRDGVRIIHWNPSQCKAKFRSHKRRYFTRQFHPGRTRQVRSSVPCSEVLQESEQVCATVLLRSSTSSPGISERRVHPESGTSW